MSTDACGRRCHRHVDGRVRGTDVAQGPLALNARMWHMGPLALDVWDVAKRGDPDLVSRRGKLAPLFDEYVESFRVGVCNSPRESARRAKWAGSLPRGL